MSARIFSPLLLLLCLSGLLAGCSPAGSKPAESADLVREPTLTAERAREALLERMGSGSFHGFDPKDWANVGIRAAEGGWYDFGGLFQIHPAKKIYTMDIVPPPEVKACTLTYEGTFFSKEGKWQADGPKLVGTALGGGK